MLSMFSWIFIFLIGALLLHDGGQWHGVKKPGKPPVGVVKPTTIERPGRLLKIDHLYAIFTYGQPKTHCDIYVSIPGFQNIYSLKSALPPYRRTMDTDYYYRIPFHFPFYTAYTEVRNSLQAEVWVVSINLLLHWFLLANLRFQVRSARIPMGFGGRLLLQCSLSLSVLHRLRRGEVNWISLVR